MLKRIIFAITLISGIVLLNIILQVLEPDRFSRAEDSFTKLALPEPEHDGSISVEEAIYHSRPVSRYQTEQLDLDEISQLLWAAREIRDQRTALSSDHPLKVYLAAGNVKDLPGGIYLYGPDEHKLTRVTRGDMRAELAAATYQDWIRDSAAIIIFSASLTAPDGKYLQLKAGQATQNVYLQAVSVDIGTFVVEEFNASEIHRITAMADDEQPLCMMPVGKMSPFDIGFS